MLWFEVKSSRFKGNEKLDMDFSSHSGRHGGMADQPADPDRNELVLLLCTQLGMMMEDLGPLALDASSDGLQAPVGEIARCVPTMDAITKAATALIDL